MIDKIINKLKLTDYIVHGSYSLYLQKILDYEPYDIDIFVEKEEFDKISKKYNKQPRTIPCGEQVQLEINKVKVEVSWEDISKQDIVSEQLKYMIPILVGKTAIKCLSVRGIQNIHNQLDKQDKMFLEGVKYYKKAKELSEILRYPK